MKITKICSIGSMAALTIFASSGALAQNSGAMIEEAKYKAAAKVEAQRKAGTSTQTPTTTAPTQPSSGVRMMTKAEKKAAGNKPPVEMGKPKTKPAKKSGPSRVIID